MLEFVQYCSFKFGIQKEILTKKRKNLKFLNAEPYSSVPNRSAGPNKRAGGKILRKH